MKTGKGPIALSDEARDRVSEQLHARYVATIVGRLREVGTLDLAAADLPIRVVDRPIDDFRTDPLLDLARYVRGRSASISPSRISISTIISCTAMRRRTIGRSSGWQGAKDR